MRSVERRPASQAIDPIRLEEWALNAWPALEQILYDGWILRFADGHTKRSNSVNPTYRSTLDLDEKIETCERAFSARGLPTIFRLTPFSQPPSLDGALADRGYETIDRTLVMVRRLDPSVRSQAASSVSVSEIAAWLDAFASFDLLSLGAMATRRRLLARLSGEPIPTIAGPIGRPLGVNLGIREDEALGLFALFVAVDARRQGLGTALVEETLRIGADRGATIAYLQVEDANHSARTLYERLGFVEAYPYWYRIGGP